MRFRTPLAYVSLLCATFIICSLVTLLVEKCLPSSSPWYLIESCLIALIMAPVFYLYFFRPLLSCQKNLEKLKNKLQDVQDAYAQTFQYSPYPMVLHDGKKILLANQAAANLYGTSNPQDLVEKELYSLIHPDYRPLVRQRIEKLLTNKTCVEILEEKLILEDGSIIEAEVAGIPVPWYDQLVAQVIIRDITERKRAEETIRKSLQEKEILLQEVHHRVKNNLQTIASLLNIYESQIQDQKAKLVLANCKKRLQAFGKIYEKMYVTPDLGEIPLDREFQYLLREIASLYVTQPVELQWDIHIDPIRWSVDKTITLACILHELLSNSLKHGLENGQSTFCIHIHIHEQESYWQMLYWDSGKGFSTSLWNSSHTLGLTLLQGFCKQIGGSCSFQSEEGGKLQLTIPKEHWSPMSIQILSHPLPADNFAHAVAEGLGSRPKWLPCRFFYDIQGSKIYRQIM